VQHPAPLSRAVLARAAYLLIQGGSSVAVFLLLARVLDPTELGVAAVALSVFVAAQALSDAGLSGLASVELPGAAAGGRDQEAAARAGLAALFLRAAVLTGVLALAAALVAPAGARLASAVIAPAAAASLLVTGAESLARARGDIAAPLLYAACGRLTFFVLAPVLLTGATGEGAVAVFSVAAVLGSAPALRALLRARTGARPTARRLRGTVAALAGAAALVTVGTRGNVFALGHLADLTQVGVFEAAWRAFQLPLYLVGALGTASTPYAATALARGGVGALLRMAGSGLALVLAAGVVAATVVYAASGPLASVFYGRASPEVAATLRVLALALPLAFVALYLQTAVLLPLRSLTALVAGAGALCAVTIGVAVALAADRGAVGCATGVLLGQVAFATALAGGAAGALRGRPLPPEPARPGG